jgi:hypothetical protein
MRQPAILSTSCRLALGIMFGQQDDMRRPCLTTWETHTRWTTTNGNKAKKQQHALDNVAVFQLHGVAAAHEAQARHYLPLAARPTVHGLTIRLAAPCSACSAGGCSHPAVLLAALARVVRARRDAVVSAWPRLAPASVGRGGVGR